MIDKQCLCGSVSNVQVRVTFTAGSEPPLLPAYKVCWKRILPAMSESRSTSLSPSSKRSSSHIPLTDNAAAAAPVAANRDSVEISARSTWYGQPHDASDNAALSSVMVETAPPQRPFRTLVLCFDGTGDVRRTPHYARII